MLGLWPFRARRNGVTWIVNRNGLRFGKDSTVLSSASLQFRDFGNAIGASLEIWPQPNDIWDSGTLLAFYSAKNLYQFSLRQDQIDLSLNVAADENHHARARKLRIKDVFRKTAPFITITSARDGVSVYIDGAPAVANRQFPVSAANFNGRFVVGDSPGQPDSWTGRLFGLAIYGRQLTQTEISRNYASWKQNGRPELPKDERNLALYLFDERRANIVRDQAYSGVNLYIPEKYEVMEKIALEPFWNEFNMSRIYWSSALKNIVGFIPFGISFCSYFSVVRPVKRATLLTVALGLCVSLTIEILQAFLPNRDSGTTDLITNTLGTWAGAASYRVLMPAVAQAVPWSSIFAPRH
jgi:VanZ family protein